MIRFTLVNDFELERDLLMTEPKGLELRDFCMGEHRIEPSEHSEGRWCILNSNERVDENQ